MSCVSVLVSVVPACPIGKAMNSTCPQFFLEGRDEGGVFCGLGFALVVAAKVPAEANFDDDEDAEALVEIGLVWVRCVWYPSGVDQVRCCPMSGRVEPLDFCL